MKLVCALLALLLFSGCSRPQSKAVVLYTSQDQFYAEPILQEFTAQTGIHVLPVFDTESAKTAGLARRLAAEAHHPQCDVFWSNEEMHTRLLVQEGVVSPGDWQSAGSRTRRIVINTNRVTRPPKSLLELTNASWKGQVAIAYPLFGTTKSHFLALRQLWGEKLWQKWCAGLVQNGVKVVDGNSVVVKLVGTGECVIGLTDSDDVHAGLHQGWPIAALEPNGECIAIPSTIALIRGAPHPSLASSLIEYLAKPETARQLISLGALERVETHPDHLQLLKVNWPELLRDEPGAIAFLEKIFIRA